MCRLASCFGVLAALILSPVQCKVPGGTTGGADQPRRERSAHSVRTQLDPKGGFLAGEDTPVWLAYREDPKNSTLTYARLERGIVKEAIEFWKSDEFRGVTEASRSVEDNANFVEEDPDDSIERGVTEESDLTVSHAGERLKRQDRPTVYHPSVLAVMEYEGDWPSDEKAQRRLVLEKILYALAFWNGVDLQLRPIELPRVRLRLSGIVIGRNKEATSHSPRYRDPVTFDYKASLEHVLEYWGVRVRRGNKDFRRGAYNIVALMTDSIPADDNDHAVSTHGPPCQYEVDEPIGALVVNDNLGFEGLQSAVHTMARILGQGTDPDGTFCQHQRDWNRRTWDKCDLNVIRASLDNNGWCLAIAKEYHRPGRPVEVILPGKLMPATKQCKARGWNHGNVCSDNERTCDYLNCSNDYWYSKCAYAGIPLDGTTCYSGMICLHGECVINSALTYT